MCLRSEESNTSSFLFLQITWLDGEGGVLSEGIEKSTREVENTRRVTAVSKIKFTAAKEHHNTTLTCQVRL